MRHMNSKRLVRACVVVSVAACSGDAPADAPPPLPAVELPADLAQVLRAYESSYSRRDSAGLADLFAADGFLLRPGRPPVRGGPVAAQSLARDGGALALVPLAYGRSDSVGYIIGTFGAERSAGEGGKFVLALTRGPAGEWRIAADIDNTNRGR